MKPTHDTHDAACSSRRTLFRWMGCACCLLSTSGLAGCGGSDPSPPDATVAIDSEILEDTSAPHRSGGASTDIETAVAKDADAATESSNAPDLTVASWDEIQAAIGDQAGKVVVVDLWSTTCLPCLRKLPDLVKLQEQFANDVVCMSVSLDYTGAKTETPESHREKILKILTSRKMTFPNYISSTSDFDIYDAIDLGSIPAVLIYDVRTSEPPSLIKRFDNDLNEFGEEGFSYTHHIAPFIEQTLAK